MSWKSRQKQIFLQVLGPLIVPVMLVIGYQLYAAHTHSYIFPTIGPIWNSFTRTWNWNGWRVNVAPSMTNLFVGYIGGTLLALALGIVFARLHALRRAFQPVIAFSLAIPSVAFVPIFYSIMGLGASTRQFIIGQAVFFQVFINVIDGLATLDPVLLQSADVYRIRGLRRLWFVDLPGAAPQIFAGARTGLSLGILVMIVSELVGAPHGVGRVILDAQNNFNYPTLWAGMLFTALLGIVLNYLFLLVEEPVLRRSGIGRRELRVKGL